MTIIRSPLWWTRMPEHVQMEFKTDADFVDCISRIMYEVDQTVAINLINEARNLLELRVGYPINDEVLVAEIATAREFIINPEASLVSESGQGLGLATQLFL